MEFSFLPSNLKRVRNEVAVLHKSQRELDIISVDDRLKEWIEFLVKMDASVLAIRAKSLSDQDICRIAGYIPFNYYKVKMDNLFNIFKIRSNLYACRFLYKYWQNSYNNKDCNKFIHDLLRDNKSFQECIRENHLDIEWMDDIIQDQNVAIEFGIKIQNYFFLETKTLTERFRYFGIHEDSNLYKDCVDAFLVYCRKEDYLNANEDMILKTVKDYVKRNQPLLKEFLSNFIRELELEELSEFRDLARYFESVVGDVDKNKGEHKWLFRCLSEDIIEKYTDWLNICKVEQYFGNDDRSEFWKQYRFSKVQRFDKSNAVVMEFKEYVAVEFLGKAAGPIYFYPREYYETTLKFMFSVFENKQMPRYLYNQTKYDKKDRFEHKGENWKNYVDAYIIEKHITRKVFV